MLSLLARARTLAKGVSLAAIIESPGSVVGAAPSVARIVRSRWTLPDTVTPLALSVSARTVVANIGGSWMVTEIGSELLALVSPRRMIELPPGSRDSQTLFCRAVTHVLR